jgi:segregation and condensation protein A
MAGPDANARAGRSAIYSVELEVFEGPLDLLLHLVRRHELEILDIPIAFITEKYLEYLDFMRSLDLEVAGDYLVMAATLAWLKSRELLPTEPLPSEAGDGDDEDGEDPREALIRRLVEYERFKNAAADLDSLPVSGRDVFARGADIDIPPVDPGLAPVTLFRLAEAYYRVLTRAKINKSHEVQLEPVTVAQRMTQLTLLLDQKQAFDFEGLFLGRTWSSERELRGMLVVTLMSVLELVKLGVARVQQVPETDAIRVYRLDASEEARALIDAYDEEASFGDAGRPPPPPPPPTEAELDAAEESVLLAEALAGADDTDLGPDAGTSPAANAPLAADEADERMRASDAEEPAVEPETVADEVEAESTTVDEVETESTPADDEVDAESSESADALEAAESTTAAEAEADALEAAESATAGDEVESSESADALEAAEATAAADEVGAAESENTADEVEAELGALEAAESATELHEVEAELGALEAAESATELHEVEAELGALEAAESATELHEVEAELGALEAAESATELHEVEAELGALEAAESATELHEVEAELGALEAAESATELHEVEAELGALEATESATELHEIEAELGALEAAESATELDEVEAELGALEAAESATELHEVEAELGALEAAESATELHEVEAELGALEAAESATELHEVEAELGALEAAESATELHEVEAASPETVLAAADRDPLETTLIPAVDALEPLDASDTTESGPEPGDAAARASTVDPGTADPGQEDEA